MKFEKPEDFYQVYDLFKQYHTPHIKKKHVRWYDREIWRPAECASSMSFLEIGSGTGEFLDYLKRKGVARFEGVEQDARAIEVMNDTLKAAVRTADIWDYISENTGKIAFDRIVMLDVLEHFSVFDGVRLLTELRPLLAADGRIVARVPNMGSPLGCINQFADLTHKASYTANSLQQLGQAAALDAVAFVDQRRGSRIRRIYEDILFWLLSKSLTTQPVVWSANIIVVFRPTGS